MCNERSNRRALEKQAAALCNERSNRRALVKQAAELRGNSDFDGAISIYSQLLAKYMIPELLNERGVTFAEKGDHVNAVTDYNAAIALAPTDSTLYVNRGNCFLRLGEFDSALQDYNTAIACDADLPQAYNGRGYIHAKIGRIEEAIDDYNQAISLDLDYASPRFNLGLLYYERHCFADALRHFDAALEISPLDEDTNKMQKAAKQAMLGSR